MTSGRMPVSYAEAPLIDFYDIHEFERSELLKEALRRCSKAKVSTLSELALIEETPAEQIWADICKAKNIEPCSIPNRVMRR
jgi:hypothetical protein